MGLTNKDRAANFIESVLVAASKKVKVVQTHSGAVREVTFLIKEDALNDLSRVVNELRSGGD